MANQRLNIDIVAKDKSTQALNKVQGSLSKVKGAVFNLRNAFVGLGAGLVIRNLVNTGKELENLRVRLKFLLKNTNEGAKAFDNMVKFASKVPFTLQEIQSGSGILATITDNADDLQKMLEITGNVAAVTGLDFRTTAEQIQRSMSAGIGAADLFREKGVRNMLGFQAGATVSIEATAEAFEKVFGTGGRFGKATDELANTFQGTLSMIGDKFLQFKFTILEAGFFEGLKKEFGNLNVALAENANMIEKLGVGVGTVLAVSVEKLANAFRLMAEYSNLVKESFKIIISYKLAKMFLNIGRAIIPVVAGMTSLVSLSVAGIPLAVAAAAAGTLAYVKMGAELDNIAKKIEENHKAFKESKRVFTGGGFDASTFNEITKELEVVDGFLYNASSELGIAIPSATQKAIDKFKELNNTALENIKNKTENIQMIIAEGINNGITKMSEGFARALVFGENLKDTLRNMAQNVLSRIIAVLIEQIVREQILVKLGNFKIGQATTLLSIERLITEQKRQQQAASAGGSGSMGSSLVSFASSFFRASGGSVQKGQPYMVGEQGPELFVPNSSGQITQNARGTGGGATTVNFNINTVDASGFEDLLVRSRGTITQLINSAVNERGSKNLI